MLVSKILVSGVLGMIITPTGSAGHLQGYSMLGKLTPQRYCMEILLTDFLVASPQIPH